MRTREFVHGAIAAVVIQKNVQLVISPLPVGSFGRVGTDVGMCVVICWGLLVPCELVPGTTQEIS